MPATISREGPDGADGPYDEQYFDGYGCAPYRRGVALWETAFGAIADAIVAAFKPRTVLDAGCAIGFLVEALRARGIDAEGVDISPYAIAQVPVDLGPYVRVASVTDELERDYDLITCIEVLEHLSEREGEAAIANMARHTSRVLFSSTPDDFNDPTHVNVRPAEYWAELFARNGLFRDLSADVSFVAPHAVVFERSSPERFAASVESARHRERSRQASEAARHAVETARHTAEVERLRAGYELQIHALRGSLETIEREAGPRDELFRARLEFEQEADALRGSLAHAERDAAEWRAWRERSGWRVFMQLVALRLRIAPPGSARDRVLRSVLRSSARVFDAAIGAPRMLHSVDAPEHPRTRTQAVMFLSGCGGDSFRYRCEHQVEALQLAGATADCAMVHLVDIDATCERSAAFVLHRVVWDETIERLITHAHLTGKPVIFDTDDLVFEHSALPFVSALGGLDEAAREWYITCLVGYRRMLRELGAASVSTERLRDFAGQLAADVVMTPNLVSQEMVRRAGEARAARPPRDTSEVVIGYLSGTPTHDRDFREAADAIFWALENFDHVRFLGAGHLELDPRFDRVAGKVERVPFRPWQELPELLARLDINLAPLEPDNPFTESKSCLKYMEAALLGVPTVASPRRDFVRVICPGENGLLADTPEQWREALRLLIESPDRRAAMGARALDDVLANRTVRAGARAEHATLALLLSRGGGRPLVVNWVVAATGAGLDGAQPPSLRLADALARRGHRVRVYLESVERPGRLSDGEVIAALERSFGPLALEIVFGHDHIDAADVSIATSCSTAVTVAAHAASLFKAHLSPDDPECRDSNVGETDDEADSPELPPLRRIVYGRRPVAPRPVGTIEADWLDPALDPCFAVAIPPKARPAPVRVLLGMPEQRRDPRALALGLGALRIAHERHLELEIRVLGVPDDELPPIPFVATNLGVLSSEERARELNEAHVFLSCSLDEVSSAPLEAMACGCAVVDVELGHVRDAFPSGAAFGAPRAEALAAAIDVLVTDPSRRIALAERGIEAAASISWATTAAQLEEILTALAFVRLDPTAAAAPIVV